MKDVKDDAKSISCIGSFFSEQRLCGETTAPFLEGRHSHHLFASTRAEPVVDAERNNFFEHPVNLLYFFELVGNRKLIGDPCIIVAVSYVTSDTRSAYSVKSVNVRRTSIGHRGNQ